MMFHLNDNMPDRLQPVGRFGWIGVDLFFVLSGYLIASQLFRAAQQGSAPTFAAFYRKRAFRILPAFGIVLALYLCVPSWREAPGMSPWWSFVTFTENLIVDYKRNHAFSHVWSLCVEEHFYLLFPLLTTFLLRRGAAWKTVGVLALLVAVGMASRAFVCFHILRPLGPDSDDFGHVYTEKIYYPTYTRLDGLLAGVSLALIRAFRPGWWSALEQRGHTLLAAGLLLAGAAMWSLADHTAAVMGFAAAGVVVGYPLLALGLALITASALSRNGLLSRLRVPGAELLATLAYSLYLTHKEVVHLVQDLAPRTTGRPMVALPLYALACLATAGALYLCVERPFLQLRDRYAGRQRAVAPLDLEARLDPAL